MTRNENCKNGKQIKNPVSLRDQKNIENIYRGDGYLELLVVFGLCVHLYFNGIDFQQLSTFLLVISSIFPLT